MKVKVYSSTKDFWREISPELRKEEAKNSLILGLSESFIENPQNCLFQTALFDGEKFLAAMTGSLYRFEMNLLPSPLTNVEHAKLLVDEFSRTAKPFKNLIGEAGTIEIYKSLLEKQGFRFKVNMNQGIYRCSKVIMPRIPEYVKLRWATADDTDIIATWIEEFHAEAVPHDPPADFRALAELRISKKMIYLLEEYGAPASIAAWSRDIGTSNSVNLVYTPIKFRRNGYASIVTAALTQISLDAGKKETNLYTDLNNPTSNNIYQKIGYQFVCNSVHYGVV